jgi:hypothetical protein
MHRHGEPNDGEEKSELLRMGQQAAGAQREDTGHGASRGNLEQIRKIHSLRLQSPPLATDNSSSEGNFAVSVGFYRKKKLTTLGSFAV